ncbi:MAG TPA: translation initiation factor IF-3 [Verrucomicrobiae bacterium]|nr:translation initiation factor IF-3 [Verrucomicrobiae bacterium]
MSRPFPSRNFSSSSFVRVNGKIRAREVRVIGIDGKQVGILSLGEALNLARASGVDLVEIAPTATPPVCRVVDYGKFRYEQAKKDKESKKHQHASSVKEVQLSPRIDPHDLSVKVMHAVDFLCEDMKVKVTLKFRGREMAHTEFGFEVIKKFLDEIAPFGHPDFAPKLVGKGINVMISPLPRNKRAKNPNQAAGANAAPASPAPKNHPGETVRIERGSEENSPSLHNEKSGFTNNPFSQIQTK